MVDFFFGFLAITTDCLLWLNWTGSLSLFNSHKDQNIKAMGNDIHPCPSSHCDLNMLNQFLDRLESLLPVLTI